MVSGSLVLEFDKRVALRAPGLRSFECIMSLKASGLKLMNVLFLT